MAEAAKTGAFDGPDFVTAGAKLAELVDLQPFQPGFLGAKYMANDGQSALMGNGQTAMELMGQWAPTIEAAYSTDKKGIGDKLGFYLNGGWWDRDGFYDNSITGNNIGWDDGYGASLKLKSDFGNGFTLEGRVSYEHYEQGQSPEAAPSWRTASSRVRKAACCSWASPCAAAWSACWRACCSKRSKCSESKGMAVTPRRASATSKAKECSRWS